MAATDISPLAGAEDEARRRAAMLNSILDAIPHGVCVYSADRRVTMFNRAYNQAMTGAPLNVGDHLETVIRRRAEAGEYGPGDPDKIFAQQMAFDVVARAIAQATAAERHDGGRAHHAAARRRLHQRGDRYHAADRGRGGGDRAAPRNWRSCCPASATAYCCGDRITACSPATRLPPNCCVIRRACLNPGRPRRKSSRTCRRVGISAKATWARERARHARQSGPVRTLPAADRHPGRPCPRCPIRSDPRRRLGHHAHRRNRGADRRDRAAPGQGGRGGGEPGQVALSGHDEPRVAHAAECGDRLLRCAAARGGAAPRVRG